MTWDVVIAVAGIIGYTGVAVVAIRLVLWPAVRAWWEARGHDGA